MKWTVLEKLGRMNAPTRWHPNAPHTMKTNIRSIPALVCAFTALLLPPSAKDKPVAVAIPAGVRHDAWDALLKQYVNEKGLVAYEKWKASDADRKALNEYLAQFAPAGTPAKGDELAASAINAYNAFAIRWILESYPTESIQALDNSFGRKAHPVGGQKVALDDLEHGTLRPLIGYRAHAALVCCARSCPRSSARPLRRRTEPSDRRRISNLVRARGSQPHFAGDKQRRGFEHLQVVQRGL